MTAVPADENRSDSFVENELLRVLFRDVKPSLVVNVLLAGLLVAGLYSYVSGIVLFTWLALQTVVSLPREYLRRAFRGNPERFGTRQWRRYFLGGTLASAALWGYAGINFLNTRELLPRCLVILMLAGVTAGAARSLAAHRASSYGYFATVLLPAIYTVISYQEAGSWILGAAVLIYLVFLLVMTTATHEDLIMLITHNASNARLLHDLQEAKNAAELANLSKSDFLTAVTQEIRTPLTGMIGMLEMLRLALVSDQVRDRLESASHSAMHLMKIINSVLDLGKVEKGELEVRREPFALQALVNECLAPFEADAAERDLHLRGVVEPGLTVLVHGDILRLRQVLVNLLANALKFTDSGFVELRLQPAGRNADNSTRVRFSVIDTGRGMDEEQIAALFRGFRTGSVASHPGKQRAGLGLLLSSRFVAVMGSELQIVSDVGRGSTFRFDMRFDEVSAEDMQAAPESAFTISQALPGDSFSVPAEGDGGGYRRLNIMVIDHDPANRLVMEHMLRNFQINPLILQNGRQALSRLSLQRWDMVFMNLHTPDKDSHESLQAMRDNPRYRRLPIVAIATQSMDKQLFLETGMTDVLVKPVRRTDLENCIRSWVRN